MEITYYRRKKFERQYDEIKRVIRRAGPPAFPQYFTCEQWYALVERCGGTCAWPLCGNTSPEPMHIIPYASGGLNVIANVQPICKRHRVILGDNIIRLVDEHGRKVGPEDPIFSDAMYLEARAMRAKWRDRARRAARLGREARKIAENEGEDL